MKEMATHQQIHATFRLISGCLPVRKCWREFRETELVGFLTSVSPDAKYSVGIFIKNDQNTCEIMRLVGGDIVRAYSDTLVPYRLLEYKGGSDDERRVAEEIKALRQPFPIVLEVTTSGRRYTWGFRFGAEFITSGDKIQLLGDASTHYKVAAIVWTNSSLKILAWDGDTIHEIHPDHVSHRVERLLQDAIFARDHLKYSIEEIRQGLQPTISCQMVGIMARICTSSYEGFEVAEILTGLPKRALMYTASSLRMKEMAPHQQIHATFRLIPGCLPVHKYCGEFRETELVGFLTSVCPDAEYSVGIFIKNDQNTCEIMRLVGGDIVRAYSNTLVPYRLLEYKGGSDDERQAAESFGALRQPFPAVISTARGSNYSWGFRLGAEFIICGDTIQLLGDASTHYLVMAIEDKDTNSSLKILAWHGDKIHGIRPDDVSHRAYSGIRKDVFASGCREYSVAGIRRGEQPAIPDQTKFDVTDMFNSSCEDFKAAKILIGLAEQACKPTCVRPIPA